MATEPSVEELQARLNEALEVLRAVRAGEVDAVIVPESKGDDRVFTLEGCERTYRLLVESISEGAFTLLPKGTIVYANRRVGEMANRPLEQVIGSHWRALFPVNEHSRIAELFADSKTTARKAESCLHVNGASTLPVQVSVNPADLDGVRVLTVVLTDISELREARESLRHSEEKYRSLNVELEQRVTERTRELALALAKARDVDRLKSEFLSTMSHELRTPLNSIVGFTRLVLSGRPGPLNAEQRKQLTMAYDSGLHLLTLINDLLDVSRIEAGRARVLRETFNPDQVIEEVVRTLRPLLRPGVQFAKDTELPEKIVSDRRKFFQILLNLGANAVKFTHQGEVRIRGEATDGQLRVEVVDTGIGIQPDNMSMLFEAFRQVDGSSTRRYEGTGLGLYLCKKLVVMLGGRIWAESEFGKGSKFSFTIPLTPVGTDAAAEKANAGGAE